MKITNLIGNPGTTLSCASPMGAVNGQGIGVRWSEESVAGNPVRVLADRSRAFGVELMLADAVLPTYEQPKIHVPHPPLERSP
ncbi:hypothetical protein [Amycolatopsis sp. GM8]|uniref:hypothetical protein n=1 Tax=Amycolatopsis sp. GM8 TaxID=2896530 RepID=UPI001F263192|nr:hypothetical protein [Amycolatopsis sp. GM8]